MPDTREQMTEDRGQKIEGSVFVDGMQQSDAKCAAVLSSASEASVICPLEGTLLAFDFGTKRIGVAVGNTYADSSQPLTTIVDEKNDTRFAAIAVLVKEWQPCALLVGLPSSDDGTQHELTALCRRFANRLNGRFNLPVILVDERYTSHAASSQLNREGITGREQKKWIDQYAAQQILQAYLDEPAAGVVVSRGAAHE